MGWVQNFFKFQTHFFTFWTHFSNFGARSPKFCMEVDLDCPKPFPNKVQKYKSTHNSAIFLCYRLQISHGSSNRLSNQMTKYKSTKQKSTKMQICKKCKKIKSTKITKIRKKHWRQLLVQKSKIENKKAKDQKYKKHKNVKKRKKT